ncbi:MAG TPA: sigma factor [Thermotogota bacterium]|nr:sigma factor [Thermotogota bacterium]
MPGSARNALKRIVFIFMRIKYGNFLFQKDMEQKKMAKQIIDEIVSELSEEEAVKKLSSTDEKIKIEERLAKQVLIKLSCEGNKKAFEILKAGFMGSIINVIKETDNNVEKHKNIAEIEETAQLAWIKIWKGLKTYKPEEANFYTWIRRITINVIKDQGGKISKEQSKTELVSESVESDEEKMNFDTKAYHLSKQAFSSPENILRDELRGELILSEVFKTRNGYPWQLLVFNISSDKKPRKIVEEHSEDLLSDINEVIKQGLISNSILEQNKIEGAFEELEESLASKLGVVILQNDSRTKQTFVEMLNDKTGKIHLKKFFGKEPTKNVSDWCRRVKARIRKNLNVNWR